MISEEDVKSYSASYAYTAPASGLYAFTWVIGASAGLLSTTL